MFASFAAYSRRRSDQPRNTERIAEIVHRLRASGEEILDTDLARVSRLCRAHIIPTGTYSFDQEMPGVNFAHNTLP
jgi:ABC-type siderophore export system fused ATPase/permease subunit